jgi:hypothetical protein
LRHATRPSGALVSILAVVLAVNLVSCTGGGGGGGKKKKRRFGVEQVDPIDGAVAVELDARVVATFSDPIQGSTVIDESFVVTERSSGRRIPGTYEMKTANQVAIFTPSEEYRRNTQYRVRIADVLAVSGHEMKDEFVSYFRTLVSQEPPPPPPPPPPIGRIRKVAPLQVGRSSHQATLLDDGRVVVTGGFDTSSTVTAVAEVYNPDTEEFSIVSSKAAIARGFHAAVLLDDERVLVVGGVTGSGLLETDHAEVFYSDTTSFATLGTKMTKQRAFHTATLLEDGRVLIAGGTVPTPSGVFSSKRAEIFDPSTDTFTALPDMGAYRAAHTATLMSDGKVLLAGGNSTDRSLEMFDPGTDTFTTLSATLKLARRGHTATLLESGDVLIMGGGNRTGELFVTEKGYIRWTPGYPLWDRKDHTASLLPGGRVLFTGGSRYVGNTLFFNNTTELYDPPTGAFLGSVPLLFSATSRHRATTLEDDNVLITGGSNLDPTQPELRTAAIYETLD